MVEIKVTMKQKQRCYNFAKEIIEGNNQFNRFAQSNLTQINRTYIGKLAELIFFDYIKSLGIKINEGDMFKIYEGQKNVDAYDFVLPNNKTIDIKTASLPFHKRIMIPIDQFISLKKDYYVGIRLNFSAIDKKIEPFSIETAIIYGYTTRKILEKKQTSNFGEGNCKAIELTELKDINYIINLFRNES